MKNRVLFIRAHAANILFLLTVSLCLFWRPDRAGAQGTLTPPPSAISPAGTPVAAMISLQQIEPRTPISSAIPLNNSPITITASGSYYLTGNLTVTAGDAIDITANGVTLDLNGFTISTTSSSGVAIQLESSTGSTDVTIVNGHILGHFACGIVTGGSGNPSNIRVSGVSVSGSDNGLYLHPGSTVVESCTVSSSGITGISAGGLITRCAVTNCSDNDIEVFDCGTVVGCSATGTGFGIVTGDYCTVKDCNASDNRGYGIVVHGSDNLIVGNNCSGNDVGIEVAGPDSLIVGNNCGDNFGDGIIVDGGDNRIDGNNAQGNTCGIAESTANSGNIITRNSAGGAGGYSIPGGSTDFAPVQTPLTATSPWANF